MLGEKNPKVLSQSTEKKREGNLPMHITEHVHDGVLVLKVSGRLTYYSRRTFQTVMGNAERGAVDHVVVNLEQAEYLDSAAIGLLVLSQVRLALKGKVLSLVGSQSNVMKVLELANIPKLIPIYQTEEEAIGLSVAG